MHHRFWSKVDAAPSDMCWEWLAGKTREGYGQFKVDGKQHPAHRVAFKLAYGYLPAGLLVRHTCDNPGCCNPNHLILGTNQDNMSDVAARNRLDKRVKGEGNFSESVYNSCKPITWKMPAFYRVIHCKYCGAEHVTAQSETQYCSRRCKELARRKRRRTDKRCKLTN